MTGWVEYYALLCWILKDASWVLLFPYTAWCALAGALTFEFWYVVRSYQDADVYQRLHRLVPLAWILGNGAWMTAELLYEAPGENINFPWFPKALIGGPAVMHTTLKALAAVLFLTGALLCGVTQYLGRAKPAGHRTLSELDQDVWVGFWALKDLFWLSAWPYPALICSAIVCALLLRARSLNKDPRGDILCSAEITWLSANTLWLIGELMLLDAHPAVRVSCFLILMIALALNIHGMVNIQDRDLGESSKLRAMTQK
mmetsp:Transcript_10947/g.20614  ORF Transcript_10947/g.20614 Transcript_10947/m.20614 type:complete len:258 (+) Transcript_10947:106-879(+)